MSVVDIIRLMRAATKHVLAVCYWLCWSDLLLGDMSVTDKAWQNAAWFTVAFMRLKIGAFTGSEIHKNLRRRHHVIAPNTKPSKISRAITKRTGFDSNRLITPFASAVPHGFCSPHVIRAFFGNPIRSFDLVSVAHTHMGNILASIN